MKLQELKLKGTNPLFEDYKAQAKTISSFFHYKNEQTSFEQRLMELQSHPIQRTELVQIMRNLIQPFGISAKQEQHLDELAHNAVTVVGGQQAGLLTGPLYSVHKAITVLLLAEQQRAKLEVPVVPVFWVAGEDHDIDEINHTFIAQNGRLEKRIYSESEKVKKMASQTELNKEQLKKWVKEIFAQYGETAFTASLLQSVLTAADESATFTDFFLQLMQHYFKKHGLLYLDAADPALRQYEAPYFERLIINAEQIAKAVTAREDALEQSGYGTPIGATEDAANLFYVKDGVRYLLTRKKENFVNYVANVSFSKEEMLQLANEQYCFSNNVVTRPMMQDMVLPVLSFVGGPGELAYWATLKDGFEVLGMKVPVFTPRLNITLVNRRVQSVLVELNLTVQQAIEGEIEVVRSSYKENVYDYEVKEVIEQTQAMLATQYETLQQHLQVNDIHLESLVEKNLTFHKNQLQFLLKKIEQDVLCKHDTMFRKLTDVEDELLGGFQERSYNPYQYLNEYGETLIDDLLGLAMQLDGTHKVVEL